LIALGINLSLTWLETKNLPRKALALSLFVVLTLTNLFMLRDVMVNAPTWYRDYGLGGMQYGAFQVFPRAEEYLQAAPETEIIISPNWANGTDVVARFFLGEPLPLQIGSVDGHISHLKPLSRNTLFVMMPEEYELAQESGKFEYIHIQEIIPYPDGEDGFYFTRMAYVDNIDEIMEQERQARMQLLEGEVSINGELIPVKYSLLDMGEIGHIFDGDQYTLGRTYEANPAIIELEFPTLNTIHGLSVIIGSTEVEIKAIFSPEPGSDPHEINQTFQGSVEQPEIFFNFDQAIQTRVLRLEIRDLRQVEPGHVHIWEINLKTR
jgi:hypothetical protein